MNRHTIQSPGIAIPGIALALLACAPALAQSNINPDQKFAWQENVGWTNWRDANAGAQGARVLEDHLAGFVWCENVGFINLGNGGGPYPEPGAQTGADFGVNVNPVSGALTGYAWGENVGWINFDTRDAIGGDAATYDASAQRFRGYAWGENIGWLNLDDATHFVATVCTGDLNADNVIDSADLAILLAAWGGTGPADLNSSGTVDSADLAILLAAWGPCD